MINEYAKAHPLENRKEKQRNRERTTSRIQQRAPAKIFRNGNGIGDGECPDSVSFCVPSLLFWNDREH